MSLSVSNGKITIYLACLDIMNPKIQTMRPVGCPISLRIQQLDYTHFGKFHVLFYQSGTSALAAALIAAKYAKSDSCTKHEVLLPAYACPDLISACQYAGLIKSGQA